MLQSPWAISPDTLDYLDADIVRFISGVMTDDFTDRILGRENFKVRRRIAELMTKHSSLQVNDLGLMLPERRRALAESIILAELAEAARAPVAPAWRPDADEVAVEPPAEPVAVSGAARGRRYVKPTRREREIAEASAAGAERLDGSK